MKPGEFYIMDNRVSKKRPETFEEAVGEVMAELRKLMINKQRDYGHRNIMDFGEYGVLVRANDKIARLKNLLGKKEPKNEAIEDSWRDLANYAIIALMLRKGTFTLPLSEDCIKDLRPKNFETITLPLSTDYIKFSSHAKTDEEIRDSYFTKLNTLKDV